jgi:hypothetical protein
MKTIKIEIIRTITSSETYVIKMTDTVATAFLKDAPSKSKEELAERAEDMYQNARRKVETNIGTTKTEEDCIEKVNYARFRDCTGDN